MTAPALFDQLADLRCAIARTRAALAGGAMIELSGLDAKVVLLIDAAKNAAPNLREDVLVTVEALRNDLDGLEADLRRQHDAAVARQALDAYGTGRRNI
jgi:hypothetical protein